MSTLWRLLSLGRPQAGWIALSIVISTAATLANIGLLATSGWFITAMGLAGVAGLTINYFTPAALIRMFAIIRTGGRYADRVISHEATLRLLTTIRSRLFAGLEPLVPADTGDLGTGDLVTRLTKDTDRLELVFLRLVSPLSVAVLTVAVIIAVLALLVPALALAVAVILIAGGFVLPAILGQLARPAGETITAQTAELRRELTETFDGLSPLLMTGAAAARTQRLQQQMDALLTAEQQVARLGLTGQAGVALSADLAVVAAMVLLIPLVATGALEGASLTMVVLGLLASAEALAAVPDALTGIPAALASARRIFAILDRTPSVCDPAQPLPLPASTDLRLSDVRVHYPDQGRASLDGLTLDIPAGSRVAIVGESGAGKSTLAALLLRLRDPDSGQVTLGGLDLRSLTQDDLHSRITMVRQSPYILSGPLADSLRLGAPDATTEQVQAAVKAAGFDRVLARLPDGEKTMVGTAGQTLSGGEVRRLAIARALLTGAPVLLLDEPGEGLDPLTEQAMIDAVLDEQRQRTVILLTHRPTGLEKMDRIIVLSAGRIVDSGPLPELLARNAYVQGLFETLP
ncbi:thiol reductant ABC exporter subunit CydC [Insolitispirillum peregrinum]|uniref:ATP-binding cassette, subfamily C, CydC n=1 Tax=Insolitispirillum peregrinum TaxID=80876 RepID=A0A1N7LAL1_9PROT|nr:thiol reductant ABC exporter subunit CydC [Insolitispirillum peregrinum]SIS70843.1 ATP-binding cassette, subfamily C, CydC [Insolitispirillum peregrinum]